MREVRATAFFCAAITFFAAAAFLAAAAFSAAAAFFCAAAAFFCAAAGTPASTCAISQTALLDFHYAARRECA